MPLVAVFEEGWHLKSQSASKLLFTPSHFPHGEGEGNLCRRLRPFAHHLKITNHYLPPLDKNPVLTIHLSIPMSRQGLTISQAARSLGVSSRTVRRFIKSGKIYAELVPGPFGEEYRIFELPPELHKPKSLDIIPIQTPSQTMGIIRELQEKNLVLAAQLGAATERIRNLENQVKLLTTTRQPWWKRLFTRRN